MTSLKSKLIDGVNEYTAYFHYKATFCAKATKLFDYGKIF